MTKLDGITSFITAAGITLAVYTCTLAPTVTLKNSGALVTAAVYLGVPNPPGYPVWTLLAWLFQKAFGFVTYGGHPNPAWAVNFMSAVFAALGCGLIALMTHRLAQTWLKHKPAVSAERRAAIGFVSGVSAGLLVGFSQALWSKAVIAETYTLNMFFVLLCLALMQRWLSGGRFGTLLAVCFLVGFGLLTSYTFVLLAPALLLGIVFGDRRLAAWFIGIMIVVAALFAIFPNWYLIVSERVPYRWYYALGVIIAGMCGVYYCFRHGRKALAMAAAFLLGLTPIVYIPFGASNHAPVNFAYARVWEGFVHLITRGQYAALAPLNPFAKPAEFLYQMAMAALFFADQFAAPIIAVGALALLLLRRGDRQTRRGLLVVLAALLSYGLLLPIGANLSCDVATRTIFSPQWIPAFAAFGLLIGGGLMMLLHYTDRTGAHHWVWRLSALAVFLLPLASITRNYTDDRLTAVFGGCEQNGHDFAWQFSRHQLEGARAIREDLSSDAPFPPNRSYPPALEPNAIFFAGTDPGRFVNTYMIHCAMIRCDLSLITQNALADNTYMHVVRELFGDRIWVPTDQDMNEAVQRYVKDMRLGRIPPNAGVNIDKSGKVSVIGIQGVMEINGIISKDIFEHNKRRHAFYVEESYVIGWMYPYLEPHGLIMKLNPEPLPGLTPDMVKRDTTFWTWYKNRLLCNEKFRRDLIARLTSSKLRCGIAGLYNYRRMFPEAEAAFRQAIDLYPASSEANFRLADVFLQQGRFQEARDVMAENLRQDPRNNKIAAFICQIQDLERESARRERPGPQAPRAGP